MGSTASYDRAVGRLGAALVAAVGAIAAAALAAGCREGPTAQAWVPDPTGGRGSGLARAPGPTPWPAAHAGLQFGAGVAPPVAVRSDVGTLATVRVVPVAGAGGTGTAGAGGGSGSAALAVLEGDGAIELVEVDTGGPRWQRPCAGGVRVADAAGVVCANADGGATAYGLDGAARWSEARALLAVDAKVAVVAGGPHAVTILDRATGAERETVALPASVAATDVSARCGDDLYAVTAGSVRRLARVHVAVKQPAHGGPPTAPPPDPKLMMEAWSQPIGSVVAIDLLGAGEADTCDDVVIVVASIDAAGPGAGTVAGCGTATAQAPSAGTGQRVPNQTAADRRRRRGGGHRPPPPPPDPVNAAVDGEIPPRTTLEPPMPEPLDLVDHAATIAAIAIDRASGRVIRCPTPARGIWPARDGSTDLELATGAGIERRARDLSFVRVLPGSPVVGALLDRRGDRRLVAGTGAAAVYVLDADGVRTWFAGSAVTAALGERAIVTTNGATAIRFAIPQTQAQIRTPAPSVAVPIHRYELPPPRALDLAAAIRPATATVGVTTPAVIDPLDPAIVWVGAGTALAQLDLRTRSWTRHADACPDGEPIGIAVATHAIACAARDATSGAIAIRAIVRDLGGAPAWVWPDIPTARGAVATLAAAGDTIVLTAGDRAIVIDARTGAIADDRRSDAGLAPMIVPVPAVGAGGTDGAAVADRSDRFAVVERDLVVVRATAAPATARWASAARGTVTTLASAGADLLVVLDAVDPYRLDVATGSARPLAAGATAWTVAGDLVIGTVATADGWALRGFGRDAERFRTAVIDPATPTIAPRAADPAAAVIVVHGNAIAVFDPATGLPRDSIAVPVTGSVTFATVVDSQPIGGVILAGAELAALTF